MRFVYIYFSIQRKEKFPLTDPEIYHHNISIPPRLMLLSRDNLNTLAIADEQQKFKIG